MYLKTSANCSNSTLSTSYFFGWTIYLKAGPEKRCNALIFQKNIFPLLTITKKLIYYDFWLMCGNVGKTQFCLHATAEATVRGAQVVFLQSEALFPSSRLHQILSTRYTTFPFPPCHPHIRVADQVSGSGSDRVRPRRAYLWVRREIQWGREGNGMWCQGPAQRKQVKKSRRQNILLFT